MGCWLGVQSSGAPSVNRIKKTNELCGSGRSKHQASPAPPEIKRDSGDMQLLKRS